jgi:hypothetical protein
MRPEIDYNLGSWENGSLGKNNNHYLSKCGKYIIWNFNLSCSLVETILDDYNNGLIGYESEYIDWIYNVLAKKRNQKIDRILNED